MKFFITLIIISLILRFVMPYIIRWAIKAFVKKTIKNGTFTHMSGPFTQAQPPQPEGKINVNYVPKNSNDKQKDFPGGEYVDYEEVK